MDKLQLILNQLSVSEYITIASSFLGAFFAFIFFIVGEYILSKWRKQKELIRELEKSHEYILNQIYFLEINIKECEEIIKIRIPISIIFNEFSFFPLEQGLHRKLDKLEVRLPIIKFVYNLQLCNRDMAMMNKFTNMLTDISKTAMVERLEKEYHDTLNNGLEKLKNDAKLLLERFNNNKIILNEVSAEIHFTFKILRAFLIRRLYFRIRLKFFKNYRKEQIQKILQN